MILLSVLMTSHIFTIRIQEEDILDDCVHCSQLVDHSCKIRIHLIILLNILM